MKLTIIANGSDNYRQWVICQSLELSILAFEPQPIKLLHVLPISCEPNVNLPSVNQALCIACQSAAVNQVIVIQAVALSIEILHSPSITSSEVTGNVTSVIHVDIRQ